MAVFCRPLVTAPAAVWRDGTVLVDARMPDRCASASWSAISATE
jgi:hypothetical protein